MSDYLYLDNTGVIVPDTADILNDIIAEYQTAPGLGGTTFNPAPSTPQGALIASDAAVRAEVVANNAAVANQINPHIAGGVFLDAICALTGVEAPPATPSTLIGVVLSGQPGLTISAGSTASTVVGDVFASESACTLDSTGVGVVNFQSVDTGPIPAAAGALSEIVAGALGWETVSNPNAAVLGSAALTDAQLRALRNQTLALQGSSLAEAMVSAVTAVTGVTSMTFRENVENTPQVIDGQTLVASSVWACVAGGEDIAVATALLTAKSGGSNWNGTTVVPVVNEASGQTYSVKFNRPAQVSTFIRVVIRAPSIISSLQEAITQTVLDYTNGLIDGFAGYVVGGGVSPFEIAGAVTQTYPGTYVQMVEVAGPNGVYQTTELELALNQIATTNLESISVGVIT